MAVAVSVLVILIFLLILFFGKFEIRIISRGRLTLRLSGTLFAIELRDFRRQKSGRVDLKAALAALRFLLGKSRISFNKTAINASASPLTRAVFFAFFSTALAYFDSASDRISLPRELAGSDEIFEFDISLHSRLCLFLTAFVIYKMKARGKALSV